MARIAALVSRDAQPIFALHRADHEEASNSRTRTFMACRKRSLIAHCRQHVLGPAHMPGPRKEQLSTTDLQAESRLTGLKAGVSNRG